MWMSKHSHDVLVLPTDTFMNGLWLSNISYALSFLNKCTDSAEELPFTMPLLATSRFGTRRDSRSEPNGPLIPCGTGFASTKREGTELVHFQVPARFGSTQEWVKHTLFIVNIPHFGFTMNAESGAGCFATCQFRPYLDDGLPAATELPYYNGTSSPPAASEFCPVGLTHCESKADSDIDIGAFDHLNSDPLTNQNQNKNFDSTPPPLENLDRTGYTYLPQQTHLQEVQTHKQSGVRDPEEQTRDQSEICPLSV